MSNPSAVVSTDALEQFIEVQRTLVHEAKWHLTDDAIRAIAVGPSNIAMFDATLSRETFEHYFTDVSDTTLGVNLDQLHDYVTAKSAGDLTELTFEPETRHLSVDVGPTVFTMALIDPASIRKEPDKPDLDLPATIGVDGATLNNALDAADMVGDHVRLAVDPDERAFSVSSQGDTDDATTTLGDSELLQADTGPDPVESLFSIKCLDNMTDPADDDDCAVRLWVGDEYPVQFEYALAEDGIDVWMSCAPRIQSD